MQYNIHICESQIALLYTVCSRFPPRTENILVRKKMNQQKKQQTC